MNDEASAECAACQGGIVALDSDALVKLRQGLAADWGIAQGHLRREFRFGTFAEALAFANVIGEISDRRQHHPALRVSWGKLEVSIWTYKRRASRKLISIWHVR